MSCSGSGKATTTVTTKRHQDACMLAFHYKLACVTRTKLADTLLKTSGRKLFSTDHATMHTTYMTTTYIARFRLSNNKFFAQFHTSSTAQSACFLCPLVETKLVPLDLRANIHCMHICTNTCFLCCRNTTRFSCCKPMLVDIFQVNAERSICSTKTSSNAT
jgi:hypothetical protein